MSLDTTTISDYMERYPERLVDGRLWLPRLADRKQSVGARWLVPEPNGFGGSTWAYCEEHNGCIVDLLPGDTRLASLRSKMWLESFRFAKEAKAIDEAAAEAAKKNLLTPLTTDETVH